MVEAAAFGCPSLLDDGGGVGAASRLRPAHGEAYVAPLAGLVSSAKASSATKGKSAGEALVAALSDRARLAVVGEAAQRRALEWDLGTFGRSLAAAVLPT